MDYSITSEQWAQYEQNGYFIAKDVVSEDAVTRLHAKITTALNRGTGEDLNFDAKRTDGENPMGAAMFRKLARLGRNDSEIWDLFYCSDNVCSINQQFLGGNVRLWFDSIFTKPAKIGEATPWHQDIGLWTQNPAQKKNKLRYKDALTIWMAIDRANQENGCLQVIPGSHKSEVIDHVQYQRGVHVELPREQVQAMIDLHGVHHIELEPGEAIVWHAHLWHYSPPNLSDKNRLGIAIVTLRDTDAVATNKDQLPPILLEGEKGEFPKKRNPEWKTA
ncbi:phytanoyl-CoA dioxygenase family protein [Chloroflexi bacterium TSY]|nr:phytanoyl-CoA dioxygenase family protein [Chloroflexi bacterium TSY]